MIAARHLGFADCYLPQLLLLHTTTTTTTADDIIMLYVVDYRNIQQILDVVVETMMMRRIRRR